MCTQHQEYAITPHGDNIEQYPKHEAFQVYPVIKGPLKNLRQKKQPTISGLFSHQRLSLSEAVFSKNRHLIPGLRAQALQQCACHSSWDDYIPWIITKLWHIVDTIPPDAAWSSWPWHHEAWICHVAGYQVSGWAEHCEENTHGLVY